RKHCDHLALPPARGPTHSGTGPRNGAAAQGQAHYTVRHGPHHLRSWQEYLTKAVRPMQASTAVPSPLTAPLQPSGIQRAVGSWSILAIHIAKGSQAITFQCVVQPAIAH